MPLFPLEGKQARSTLRRVQAHETGPQMAACKPARALRAARKTRHGAPKPGAGLACKFSCRRHGFRGAHGCKLLRLHRTSRCGREFAPPLLVEQVSRSADISRLQLLPRR